MNLIFTLVFSFIPIWLTSSSDRTAWIRFWTRKVCTIIVPFIVLAFCNARIVFHLQHKRLKSKQQSVALKRQRPSNQQASFRTHNQSIKRRYSEKRGVRVATRTLVMVVGCYLISNSMNTIINIWEYFDSFFLRHQHYYAYLIASDFSVLVNKFIDFQKFQLKILVNNCWMCPSLAYLCDKRRKNPKSHIPSFDSFALL